MHLIPRDSLYPAMILTQEEEAPLLQKLVSKAMKPLATVPAHVCQETGDRYVFWADIQQTIQGIDFLRSFSMSEVRS